MPIPRLATSTSRRRRAGFRRSNYVGPTLLLAIFLAAAQVSRSSFARTNIDVPSATIHEPDVVIAPPLSNEVRVEQHGDRILVHAQSDIAADRIAIWSTLRATSACGRITDRARNVGPKLTVPSCSTSTVVPSRTIVRLDDISGMNSARWS